MPRLASIGIDIEDLDFFHDPSKAAITRAKRTLVALGALTRDNAVTHIGKIMEQFPVESSYGRMLVEAQQYSSEVQTKLSAIIERALVPPKVRRRTKKPRSAVAKRIEGKRHRAETKRLRGRPQD